MKTRYLIIIILFLLACKRPTQIIHYEYKGINVNRLNKGEEVFFSYGYSNDEEEIIHDASVVVDISFDHSLAGFMLFRQDGYVEIISGGGGSYKSIINNKKLFYNDSSKVNLSIFRNSNYNNLREIGSNLELEKSRNDAFGSKVSIIR